MKFMLLIYNDPNLLDAMPEGAFDSDVQLRRAIEQGIVSGPRLLVVTRAIVATGSYGPRRRDYSFEPGQGAEEASGPYMF